MTISVPSILEDPPALHNTGNGVSSAFKLADEELLFLDSHLLPWMKTVETGCGLSTVVFALKGTDHTCIVPAQEEVDRVRDYCETQGIATAQINFIVEPSEAALPKLPDDDFDFALIDGRHGFPAPFIDWFYMAERLKVGGCVMIDDLHIHSCEHLFGFLHEAKDWTLVMESLSGAVFQKLGDHSLRCTYTEQPFVWRRSRQGTLSGKVRYLAGLIRRRNWSLFKTTVSLGVEGLLKGRFGDRGSR